jgi:hypothetical protein
MTKFRETFTTPFEQYKDRIGQRFVVIRKITKRNATEQDRCEYDLEALPMYKIRFVDDGHETSAWPEEIEAMDCVNILKDAKRETRVTNEK